MLTDAQYVAKQGQCCPHCESSNIEAADHTFEGGEVTQDVECLDCKETWVDVYRLVGWVSG